MEILFLTCYMFNVMVGSQLLLHTGCKPWTGHQFIPGQNLPSYLLVFYQTGEKFKYQTNKTTKLRIELRFSGLICATKPPSVNAYVILFVMFICVLFNFRSLKTLLCISFHYLKSVFVITASLTFAFDCSCQEASTECKPCLFVQVITRQVVAKNFGEIQCL